MSTMITLQLNATTAAGDWATRPAGEARTGTGTLGGNEYRQGTNELAVYLNELRGAVESIKRGAHSPSIADSCTDMVDVGYGTPALYSGMRFYIGA